MSSAGAYLFDVVRSPRGKARADGGLAPLKPQELVRQLCASLDTRLDDEVCARAEALLLEVGFLQDNNPDRIYDDLRTIAGRASLDAREVTI